MNFKFMMLISVLSIIILFSGCSSNVSVGSHILPNGTYRQTYVVNLDTKELATKHTNEEIEKIYNVTFTYISNYLSNLDNKAKQFELRNGYVGEHCIHKVTSSQEGNIITINSYILFSSVDFYNKFKAYVNNETLDENGEEKSNEVKEGLFYDKIILTQTTNPVADADSILNVYNEIETNLLIQGVDFKFDLADLNLSYDYAVPYTYAQVNRLKSNADKEYLQVETTESGSYQMKHFVWNYDKASDNEVIIYRYVIKNYIWYLTALISVVIFGLILWLIYFLMKKFKKPKINNDNIVEIDSIVSKNEDYTIKNSEDNNKNI